MATTVSPTSVIVLGLDWNTQHCKLKADSILGATMTEIVIFTPTGPKPSVFLPLKYLAGYLFKITPSKVAPALRPKILASPSGSGQTRTAPLRPLGAAHFTRRGGAIHYTDRTSWPSSPSNNWNGTCSLPPTFCAARWTPRNSRSTSSGCCS
ncbi:phage antirepressor N-terminal domain-containing protein [Deinococcus soli (ex Cha et al. 2016)]|uniref:phage antirepressor N-terminal domain-containing protein n=1 Tax=Deinococcus soli (ex Cha et al. 2016) TaxID=1309411 RepID=UPI00166299B9